MLERIRRLLQRGRDLDGSTDALLDEMAQAARSARADEGRLREEVRRIDEELVRLEDGRRKARERAASDDPWQVRLGQLEVSEIEQRAGELARKREAASGTASELGDAAMVLEKRAAQLDARRRKPTPTPRPDDVIDAGLATRLSGLHDDLLVVEAVAEVEATLEAEVSTETEADLRDLERKRTVEEALEALKRKHR